VTLRTRGGLKRELVSLSYEGRERKRPVHPKSAEVARRGAHKEKYTLPFWEEEKAATSAALTQEKRKTLCNDARAEKKRYSYLPPEEYRRGSWWGGENKASTTLRGPWKGGSDYRQEGKKKGGKKKEASTLTVGGEEKTRRRSSPDKKGLLISYLPSRKGKRRGMGGTTPIGRKVRSSFPRERKGAFISSLFLRGKGEKGKRLGRRILTRRKKTDCEPDR